MWNIACPSSRPAAISAEVVEITTCVGCRAGLPMAVFSGKFVGQCSERQTALRGEASDRCSGGSPYVGDTLLLPIAAGRGSSTSRSSCAAPSKSTPGSPPVARVESPLRCVRTGCAASVGSHLARPTCWAPKAFQVRAMTDLQVRLKSRVKRESGRGLRSGSG